MLKYLLRRSAILLIALLVAMLVMFFLLRILPGDPANALLAADATKEQIAAAQKQFSSDLPLWQQFIQWVTSVFSLDWGQSIITKQDVLPEVLQRLKITLPLTFISFIFAFILAALLGVLGSFGAKKWWGIIISGFSQLGIAVPVFWVAIILVWIFAIELAWFPSGGFPRDDWQDPIDALYSLFLPILTIVIVMSASLARYIRSASLDALDSGYIQNARALGASKLSAFTLHGIRNSALPIIAVMGFELASTFLGAVVIENVFSLPGIGSMLVVAIEQHDYPSIQAVLLLSTLFVLIIGFVADISARIVDPRVIKQVEIQ